MSGRQSSSEDAPASSLHNPEAGFTLVELVIVITLIGVIVAIAGPQLMPAIVLSRLEGTARHIAGYGRSVMAQAGLTRDTLTVRIDLDKQEYWTEHHVKKKHSIFDDDKKDKEGGAQGEGDKNSLKGLTDSNQFLDLLNREDDLKPEEEGNLLEGANMLRQEFDRFARMQMLARARTVKREGILDEIGPLFEKKFSLDDEEDEIVELEDPLLSRTVMPEGIVIESVHVGSTSQSKGTVDIEVTPLGLDQPVVLYVKGEEGDYYTVVWDPISMNARAEQGKKDIPDHLAGMSK